ncbi:MAG: hypothetical protein ACKVWR_08810, partial [Acidimicrobiales bacterium]
NLALELPELARSLLPEIQAAWGADLAVLALFDDPTTLRLYATAGEAQRLSPGGAIELGEGLFGDVARTGQARSAARGELTEQDHHLLGALVVALQQQLLPQAVHDPPMLALAVRYVAGADRLDMGGDWYDCVE